MQTLGGEYPNQQARCRVLLKTYADLGPAGVFGAAYIKSVLKRADKAAMSGDVVEMVRAFHDMKGCE